jgi:hypothetical protein
MIEKKENITRVTAKQARAMKGETDYARLRKSAMRALAESAL